MNPTRVLIVEDDSVSAATLARLLESQGFAVVDRARTGEEALSKTMQHSPDIVLTDIMIEGDMDGVDAAAAIRRFADIPIVYTSGKVDDATVSRAAATNPFGYIVKPYNDREIAITLQMALYKNEMDRKLRESRLQLMSILSSMPSAIVQTTADGSIEYMNPTAELYARHSHERVRGQLLWEALELRDIRTGERIRSASAVLFASDRAQGEPRRLLHLGSGPERRIVEPWSTLITDSAGSRQGYVLTLRDVTEQHEAEQSQQIMAAALRNLDDAVLITTPATDEDEPSILYANPGFERITGWTPEEAKGQPITLLRNLQCADQWEQMMESLRDLRSWRGEFPTAGLDDREFTGQWSASVIRGSGGAANYVFGIRDVTHMRRLEENINQSQKIEAVGRLAGGIAHDFNNLLSVINSYCDLQILKLDEDTPAMKYARQIRAAGRKGAELVSQLMTFSRRDKPNPSNLDLCVLVNDVQGMLRRVIREDIELETHLGRDVRQVRADQGQVEQALLNLCVNARDAMPNGGRILIEVFNREIEKGTQTGRETLRPGSYVVLSVSDTGCGMDEQTQKHIFEPFFTTKEIGKGTGLGLATVFGIMKQCGGVVAVKSKPGDGARFELIFPASNVEKLPMFSQTEETTSSPQGDEVVLVVEDDETFLDCISGLLTLHGYKVYTAGDGATALAQMQRLNYKVNLLVSDLVLPKLSGREVAARMVDKNPLTKVVFMTGYDDQLDTFYQLPGDATILEKPFPLNQLLVKVRELLDAAKAAAEA